MIDLKKIGEFFTSKKLWDKPFNQWSRDQMLELAEVFFSSPGPDVPRDGWKKPYIKETAGNEKGQNRFHLIIPIDSHPLYHWWKAGGKTIIEILTEIGASGEVIEANRPVGYDPDGMHH